MVVLPYELRVGVTGHRALADPAAVAAGARALLARVAGVLRADSTPLAWTIVSPLARGADRILAQAVLELPGARLEVVTPFPLAEYRKDFPDPAERAEFDALLQRAAATEELDGAGQGEEVERSLAYLRAGEHVVDACELLVTVWDGQRAAGVGGTADIVAYALQRERVVLWIPAQQPTQPPRLVRAISDAPEGLAVAWEPFPREARSLSRGFQQRADHVADPAVTAERRAGL